MSESTATELDKLRLRAALPRFFAVGAAAVLVATVCIGLAIFFLTERPSDFRMKGFPTKLSKDVVAVVDGYERRETDGSLIKYFIKADRATTFTDNHQELENIYLEVYDDEGSKFDKITAKKAVYVPGPDKTFTAYFSGQVAIDTRDSLNIRTEQLTYAKATETVEAEEKIEFSREEFRGSSLGALVNIKEQRLELFSNVEFSASAAGSDGELGRNGIESFKGSSAKAMIDQAGGKATLSENVQISVRPREGNGTGGQPATINASEAAVHFVDKVVSKVELVGGVVLEQAAVSSSQRWFKTQSRRGTAYLDGGLARYELNEEVEVQTGLAGQSPSVIKAEVASYDKQADRFDLRQNVSIVTQEGDRQVTLSGSEGVYEQIKGKALLKGSASVETQTETLKAAIIEADIDTERRLRKAVAKGSAFLQQRGSERTVDVSGGELSALFDDSQRLRGADATGKPKVMLVPVNATGYSSVTMSSATAVRAAFASGGFLKSVDTEGRTTIDLTDSSAGPDSADKMLSADEVRSTFAADGKSIARAQASGAAELQIVPKQASDAAYRTKVTAPAFDCEFFPVGNNAKSCSAGPKTRTVRTPTITRAGRGDQVLNADRLLANFNPNTQDLDTLEAQGAAKFNELDRNGTSSKILYQASSRMVSLREGQPTVWDSKGRARAQEIDIDTRDSRSMLRGGVSTTYFNQRQLNGSTPFSNSSGPVYVTADSAEFVNAEERAVFTGNARAWQANNFIRGDVLEIQQAQKKILVSGSVQTLIFDARVKGSAKDTAVPVYGSSRKLSYDGSSRRVVYEGGVELRQGSDRLAGEQIVALLNDQNELLEATANTAVSMTQPGRKATGEFAQYKVSEELVVLRGSPATVEDSVNGSSEGAEITVFLRDRKAIGEGRTKANSSGRMRSVYKVKKNQ